MYRIYDYKCPKCLKISEHLTNSSIDEKIICEVCNMEAERIVSGFGIYEIRGNNSASTSPKNRTRKKQDD